jgi:PD-(D/E)XK nuclease superfamily protein
MNEVLLEGYPRVSDFLRSVPDVEIGKDGKINFVFKYHTIDQQVLENKQRIGTNVHHAISSHLNDCYCPPLSDDEKGYFDSFLLYCNVLKLKPLLTETRFHCHDLKISGQIDLINSTSKGAMLIDFKTSAVVDKKKWPLQGAFYWYLCHKNGIELKEEVLFLQLMKDGSKPNAYYFNIDEKLKSAMLSVINIYRYLLT